MLCAKRIGRKSGKFGSEDSPLSSWGYIYLVSLGDEQVMAGEEAQPKMTFHITRAALSGWGLDSLPARFVFLGSCEGRYSCM